MRSFYSAILALLVTQSTCLIGAQTHDQISAQTSTKLELAKPVQRALKVGETHSYGIQLETGQTASIVVEQRGIDVFVVLFTPDGKILAEVDSQNGITGPEPLLFVAKESANYHLQVRPVETAWAGTYEIKLETVRTATLQDIRSENIRSLAAALASADKETDRVALLAKNKELITVELVRELYQHGRRFRNLRNYAPALTVSQLSLGLAEQIGDQIGVSDALYNIGYVFHRQGDNDRALEYQQRSLVLRQSLGDNVKIVDSFNLIGLIHRLNGNSAEAISAYQKSLPLIETMGNKQLLANVLSSLGYNHFLLGNYGPAMECNQKSLKISEEIGNKLLSAYTLNRIGNIYRIQGDFQEALKHVAGALMLSEELNNKELKATLRMTEGLIHSSLGDKSPLGLYEESLSLAEEAGNKELAANAMVKIGSLHFRQGNVVKALGYLEKSLKLNEEIKNKRQIIFTLSEIGYVHLFQGDNVRSMEYFQKCLRLSEEIGNKFQVAGALNAIGAIYKYQRDDLRALEYFYKSLKLNEEIGNAAGVLNSLTHLGDVYCLKGHFEQALEYYQKSLKLSEKISSKRLFRGALGNIGNLYRLQGNFDQAMTYSQKSLALSEELEDNIAVSDMLIIVANIYSAQGNYEQAQTFSERAVTLARQTQNSWNIATGLVASGRAYRSLRHFDKSKQAFEEAISTIELDRSTKGSHDARATYFAAFQDPYDLYIDLLMQMHREDPGKGFDVLASNVGERARARSLLEFLNETRAAIQNGADPGSLERLQSLQQQLNAQAEQWSLLTGEKYSVEQASQLKKEMDVTIQQYREVEAELRTNSPRYAALTQPQPLSVAEIQRDLLDSDTVLLEYTLGEEQGHLWLITQDSLKSYQLPNRGKVEAVARLVYELLQKNRAGSDRDPLVVQYIGEAERLTEMLLGPVRDEIKGKRLVIVSDGALQYIPFSALPSPRGTGSSAEKKMESVPLAVTNEIVSLPSASVLAVLRREAANRNVKGSGIAVVADPVFSATDERLSLNKTLSVKSDLVSTETDLNMIALQRAFSVEGDRDEALSIARLPFTRREAESIFLNAPAGSSRKVLDFNASRETILNADLSKYRILHFATHGILHSEYPELSGIVLSLINEKGEPVNGFLRLNEIYNLNLNADLVVLSACQTALGKEVRGEGLIGLTRGFMYAGSPRVVASLWKVDDLATAELMKIFYQKMLKDKMRPAAALRAAKVAMWKTKRWNSPYYWAAFELQGDWR